MAAYNLKLPDELHAKFKSKCALERVDMQDKLLEFIKKEVEEGISPEKGGDS